MKLIKNFIINESGATAIEYAFIAGSICVVIAGTVSHIGSKLANSFANIQASF